MDRTFKLCIIGDGMIGAGAAYHASKQLGQNVVVIGPGEGNENILSNGDIFGAWHDEGRIFKTFERSPECQELAKRSIARYRTIEKESGIHFYSNIGCIFVYNKDYILQSDPENSLKIMEISDFHTKFPFLNFKSDQCVLFNADGGHLNPRKYRHAQLDVAQKHGCCVITDIAKSVKEIHYKCYEIKTDNGIVIKAENVLVCTGAFCYSRNILPMKIKPELSFTTETVLKWEVSEEDLQKLSTMPCVSYKYSDPALQKKDIKHFYVLPPILSPNGKYLLKIGHVEPYEKHMQLPLKSSTEFKDWFLGNGSRYAISYLDNALSKFLKGVEPISKSSNACVTTNTDDGKPVIDLLKPGYGVALGGNGISAKSGNEIGRIAVDMVLTGHWNDYKIPHTGLKLNRHILSQL